MLDRELFQRLQALSRLRLPPEEEEILFPQLERILEFVRHLEAQEGPLPSPGQAFETPALREDIPAAGLTPEEALAAAASTSGGLFRVPPALPPEAS